MKLCRTPVVLFLLATSFPFVVSFAFFIFSQRLSLLTEPEVFIEFLGRTGSAFHMISLNTWKYFLARSPLCNGAEAIVIGSSRVREIDATVVGTSVCNLYVDGLSAPGFAHMAERLAPMAPGQHRVVYVGIDHWWHWADTHPFDRLEITLLSGPRTLRILWKVWAVIRPLDFFTISDLLEAVRRYRQGNVHFEDQSTVWFPDGHLFHQRYYAQKRIGIHISVSQEAVEENVKLIFGKGRLHESHLRALEKGVRLLHAKGYTVRMFWNPVSHAHIALVRHHFPVLFQQTIDAIDQLAATLSLDRYLPASQTLDSSRFGCTKRDDFDEMHVDLDCIRRVFAVAF